MEIEEELEEVIAVAKAYLQGAIDATPPKDRPCFDAWYAYKDFDINVDGSAYYGGNEDTLRVWVYHHGNMMDAIYKGESNGD